MFVSSSAHPAGAAEFPLLQHKERGLWLLSNASFCLCMSCLLLPCGIYLLWTRRCCWANPKNQHWNHILSKGFLSHLGKRDRPPRGELSAQWKPPGVPAASPSLWPQQMPLFCAGCVLGPATPAALPLPVLVGICVPRALCQMP